MKNFIVTLFFVAFAFGFASSALAAEYTVQKGDSLWSISKKYNVPFTEILRLNKHIKNPDMIYPNDKIILPDNSTGTSTGQNSQYDKIENGNNPTLESGQSSQANAVLKLVNEERAKQGLKSLTLSTKLTSIATTKSKDMATNKYFSHQSPTYGSPFQMLQHFGVTYKTAGENIAAGQRTPEEVMKAWMNSSGHRANILNPKYTQLGVGYYKGGSYGVYWTQLFTG